MGGPDKKMRLNIVSFSMCSLCCKCSVILSDHILGNFVLKLLNLARLIHFSRQSTRKFSTGEATQLGFPLLSYRQSSRGC